jgi:ABC-type transporter Mla MlaB component
MLRIMITEGPFEQKWILQGRLSGQWAADLKEKWAETRSSRIGRNCVVDLEDVITVDQTGESALLEMASEGALLIARRAYMKSVLEGLRVAQHERNQPHVDH